MDWRDAVTARLTGMQPGRVYALNEDAGELARAAVPTAIVAHAGDPGPGDVALGVRALDGLTLNAANQLISETRLYRAPRLLLVEATDGPLDVDAFRALGFRLHAEDAAAGCNVYDFDIDTYKPVPDWLNARYWAHPERWKP